MRHKWANEIISWANGDPVQYKNPDGIWSDIVSPSWYDSTEYRIKPKLVKKWQWAYPEIISGEQCLSVWKLTEKRYSAGECHLIGAVPLLNTEIEE